MALKSVECAEDGVGYTAFVCQHLIAAPTFVQTLPGREDQQKLAHANAEPLYGLEQRPSRSNDQRAQLQEQS